MKVMRSVSAIGADDAALAARQRLKLRHEPVQHEVGDELELAAVGVERRMHVEAVAAAGAGLVAAIAGWP